MTVTVEPVADAIRHAVRPHALPLIAVTPAGLKGVVGPTGFVKAAAPAPSGSAPHGGRAAAVDDEDFHRAMQESMDLRDQGHA